MPRRLISVLVCLGIAACAAVTPPPDTSQLPPNVFGIGLDNDTGAINQATWAFAVASRTHGDPVDAIKAVVAVDYLAGELSSNPRWIGMSPLTKLEMLQARQDVRQVLGIAPNASSQLVVNSLLQAAWYLQSGDQQLALQALAAPVFTLPPPQTLARLSDLPYIQSANVATLHATQQEFGSGTMFGL